MSHLSHEFLERYGKTPFLNGVKVIAIILSTFDYIYEALGL